MQLCNGVHRLIKRHRTNKGEFAGMSALEEILLILGMMSVTFGVRYSVLALSGRMQFSKQVEQALSFVPVAVLTALCVPILFKPEGSWLLSFNNSHLVAGVVSIVIAAVSRHLLLTIILGMGLFLVLHLGLI